MQHRQAISGQAQRHQRRRGASGDLGQHIAHLEALQHGLDQPLLRPDVRLGQHALGVLKLRLRRLHRRDQGAAPQWLAYLQRVLVARERPQCVVGLLAVLRLVGAGREVGVGAEGGARLHRALLGRAQGTGAVAHAGVGGQSAGGEFGQGPGTARRGPGQRQ